MTSAVTIGDVLRPVARNGRGEQQQRQEEPTLPRQRLSIGAWRGVRPHLGVIEASEPAQA